MIPHEDPSAIEAAGAPRGIELNRINAIAEPSVSGAVAKRSGGHIWCGGARSVL
jgi:hypothetical protein